VCAIFRDELPSVKASLWNICSGDAYFAAYFVKTIVLSRWFLVNADIDLLKNYACILQRPRAFCWYIHEGKHSAVTAQLTITAVPYGTISPSKLPLPMGDLHPDLINGSSDLPESASQMASWLVQSFLQGSQTWPTDTHTDGQTESHTDWPCYSECSSRLLWLAIALMQPNNNDNNIWFVFLSLHMVATLWTMVKQ